MSDLRNIRLELAYDGTAYSGWQVQSRHKTVQGELNRALSTLFAEPVSSNGAGRTDAGAHALCYTANFRAANPSVPVGNVPRALNGILPADVRVLAAREVEPGFHAQFSAKAREYVYLVSFAETPLPHFRNYIYCVRAPQGVIMTCPLSEAKGSVPSEVDPSPKRSEGEAQSKDSLRQAQGDTFFSRLSACARLFTGERDFAEFTYGYGPDEEIGTVRRIDHFRVAPWSAFGMTGAAFTIRANGFLRGMIRTLVPVCLNFAAGKITEDEIVSSLAGEHVIEPYRKAAVPACGLYFKRAGY